MTWGVGFDPYDPFRSGMDPMTGKWYFNGQVVHHRSSAPKSASTGARPRPKPIANPYVAPVMPQNKRWQIPRGEMDQILQQYQNEVAATTPDVGGMTWDQIAAALGAGSPARKKGSRGRGAGYVPKFSDIQKVLTGAGTNIAGAYNTAGADLAKLMGEYAAADAARKASAAQTLQAFGAPASAMDVGGMSAMDVLAALRGQLIGQQGMQQADIEQQLATYKAMLGGK